MYEGFARVYDDMMEDIPYDEWFDAVKTYLSDHGVTGGTMCELGCGTGAMTERFAVAGYSVLGVDLSEDMLTVAQEKKQESGLDIMYIHQDMRELQLAEPVDVMVSLCDSMNYLLQEEELSEVFRRVYQFLKPGGYLIFDLKTIYCYRNIIGSQTWAESGRDLSYIWENYFYEDEAINEYTLTIFCRRPDSGLYERLEEIHYQRAYPADVVQGLLEDSGLVLVDCLDASMKAPPAEDSERIYMIAMRRGDQDER